MNQNPTQENERNIPAIIFTKAFTGDPFFSWLFPGEKHQEALYKWWDFLAQNAKINPQWILTSDPTESTSSIWTKPVEGSIESDPDDAQTAFINLVQGLVGDRLPKVLEVFAEVDASHPKEPHWYLQAVGTVPQMQGRGIAARILKPILEICDAEGVGAYLESTNPRNLSFYYRLGFKVKTELLMDGGKAALTCMWREPT